MYPFTFRPIYKERIWGGRRLSELYGKPLPPAALIGESWEISDRPADESIVANGPLAGRSLRWLMTHHRRELLGETPAAADGRFPLLCKILDAREKLSLQVHPPADKAVSLGGEPKTEMWYIAEAGDQAELFVGLRRGVTPETFEAKVRSGDVAECFHRIPVRAGDTMFLPSGRVHAIGAGLVIFEIQQNSDTTYRVFDWNRTGLDGQPRELHVGQSLASIDFDDFEPSLVEAPWTPREAIRTRPLVRHALFNVDEMRGDGAGELRFAHPGLRVIAMTEGSARVDGGGVTVPVAAGQFVLVPAALAEVVVRSDPDAHFLVIAAD